MIRYQIRSIALLNVVNDIKSGRLVPDAYFQRNLVWRDVHKRDFIDTILRGYPFPQMFFSRGKIDVEKMSATACIVDGQQRTNAILEFVDNKLDVNGRYFRNLNETEKSDFLKYEIGVIELDLENDDPQIKEIFARVNRTSNSLTTIEKLTSEYAPTEYMFTARLIADDIAFPEQNDDEADWKVDPNTPADLFEWAKDVENASIFAEQFRRLGVFSEREIARRVHVMYVLNIISTILAGFFNRNEKTLELLDEYSQQFPQRDNIVLLMKRTSKAIAELNLPPNSFWTNKANFFSLVIAISECLRKEAEIEINATRNRLLEFAEKPGADYSLAAREGVNNRKQRADRNAVVMGLLTLK
jgi:hypothetical protein